MTSGGAPVHVIAVHGRDQSAAYMAAHLVAPVERLAGDLDVVWHLPESPAGRWYEPTFTELTPCDHRLDELIGAIDAAVTEADVSQRSIFLVGFSQGACGVAEYAARHPGRWGGIAVLSGARVGPADTSVRLDGDMRSTPTLLAASENDRWIPLDRLEATAAAFSDAGADVTVQISPGDEHVIGHDAHDWLARLIGERATLR